MGPARLACLLLLGACSSPQPEVAREAPDVHFKRAAVLAAISPENRKQVEDLVAAEIERRRPDVSATSTWEEFPDLGRISTQGMLNYLQFHGIDLLVTIVPFSETISAGYDDWSDVAQDELGGYVGGLTPQVLAGRFGVQVVGWNVPTRAPVYAKTSEILIGDVAGPRGVADFAIATVTREL